MTIRKFYVKAYPTDELGDGINPKATFDGLFRVLDNYGDVYEYLCVYDSIIRERVFEKLAEIMGVDYNEIYDQWLMAA